MKKTISLSLCLLLLLSLLAGCGATASNTADYAVSEQLSGASGGLYESAAESGTSTVLPENRKLIKTVYLDAETQDLDTLLAQLDTQVAEMGGNMEERSVHNASAYSSYRYRSASMTIRIPAAQVDAFVARVAEPSNIISSNQSVEDVTLAYVDTESRVAALETEQERLLALMEKAETMADLLTIEERLTEVRYQLEQITSQLRVYDNLIDYATIHLDIRQVRELTEEVPETFWERISTGFMESLSDLGNFFVELAIALIVGLPYIVVFGGIAVVAVVFIRRRKGKRRAKKQHPPANESKE